MTQTTARFSPFALLASAALVLAGCGVGTDGGATRAVAVEEAAPRYMPEVDMAKVGAPPVVITMTPPRPPRVLASSISAWAGLAWRGQHPHDDWPTRNATPR